MAIGLLIVLGVGYAGTAAYLWARCLPAFRPRLAARIGALTLGYPLLAFRMQSWYASAGLVAIVLVSGWLSTGGHIERYFPRRWFYPTGEAPPWLSGIQIVAFFVLLTAGLSAGYLITN